jgi:hypothetical protein
MQTILSDPTRNVHPADPSRRPDPHPARHAAARRSFPHTPTPCPTCPGCSGLLEPVRQSDTSPLNRHQFDAVKAGDWFCRNCKGDRSATGFRYYWHHELPAVVVIDETRGQTLDPADASEAAPDVLTLGMLAGGSPYFPDVPDCVPPADAADWLSDAGRCELDAVPPLLARLEREAPGVTARVAVSFGVGRLADGTVHFDRRPGWELTAWRGTETYNGSGHDLERLAACCAARFVGAGKAAARG